jgi:hypothetical protein
VSSDSIGKGIIDDIINTAVKTAEVDEQKTKRKHEKVISRLRIFRSTLALSRTLFHVLAHFQRTCSQIYFFCCCYLLRKPLLRRSTAFICNIDRDWMIYRKNICIFYAIKTNKNACIIRSECTHYAYILLCKQTFQIRSVLVR